MNPLRNAMNHIPFRSLHSLLAGLLLLAVAPSLRADIKVRLSVKFIHDNDATGSPPAASNIGTQTGFAAEVVRGNAVLAATGRGYTLEVVEYLPIQPPAPANQPADYWFNLPARSNKQTIENAALAATAVWRWHPSAINIYVNNSASGQCSFVGGGSSIALGSTIGIGTVLHEIGHFFNLAHTHAGDYADQPNPASGIFTAADLHDGDGFAETANDNPNIGNHDQLSGALFGHNYNAATAAEKATVDSAYENVMSYHNENTLLSVQSDYSTLFANNQRNGVCNGKTWFLATDGSTLASGTGAALPLATISAGLSHVATPNDILLLRAGSYSAPPGGTISTPCTLRATRGSVTIHTP